MKYLIILCALFFIRPAWAYLDPGTGSMLLQVVLGGIAAVGVALKLGWHKIRVAFGFAKKTVPEKEQEEECS